MRNLFHITGYAVNKRGLTVGFSYLIDAEDAMQAKVNAIAEAKDDELTHVSIARILEVAS